MRQPTHPVLIVNPRSGGGTAERPDLVGECIARGIEPVELHPGDDLLGIAEDIVARGADSIGVAGFDGSQALAATVAALHDLPYVCVPAGTRNHSALDVGVDRWIHWDLFPYLQGPIRCNLGVAGEASADGRHPMDPGFGKGIDMALSDQLSALAVRAKLAEDRASVAEQKAKQDIERDMEAAHAEAMKLGEALRQKAELAKSTASAGWDTLQRSWNENLASLKKRIDEKKAEHNLESAKRRAYGAEEDAEWAVHVAMATIEEAEYASLNAILARKEVEELEKGARI